MQKEMQKEMFLYVKQMFECLLPDENAFVLIFYSSNFEYLLKLQMISSSNVSHNHRPHENIYITNVKTIQLD